jgi:hypothetical protein
MKSKAYMVNRLCELKGIPSESEEAQKLYDMKVLDLLSEIKKYGGYSAETLKFIATTENANSDDDSFAKRLGCFN